MEAFAELLDRLVYTAPRNAKLKLLEDYFRAIPDPDRGWALVALTDGLPFSLPVRRTLATIMEPHADPVLYQLSRDYVGDTAETVALLWPDRTYDPPRISEVVEAARQTSSRGFPRLLEGLLDRLDIKGRFALIKLFSGALRVGISARLARQALANLKGCEVNAIEEVWHGLDPPFTELFAWIDGKAPRPDMGARPVFRPVMLAHPIEESDWAGLAPEEIAAEWKWDGIRVQVAAKGGQVRVYSRAGDDVSGAFPDIVTAFLPTEGVLDGELLVVRDGVVAPFNDLQQRLNRKSVTGQMLDQFPAHVRLYDLLFDGPDDLRELSFEERRARLEAWFGRSKPSRSDLSTLVEFADFAELERLWQGARENGIEGLMLKRKASPYLPGRPKGHWYKWKRAALTLDCVLMYAQRGSGKRSSYYSDYTFGVWKDDSLVPVGKAYSGFTDDELLRLDRWIRNNTTERFGPVRAVPPGLVFEVAFDGVQPSVRHKSGVALRFPRIHRIRWDKPANEADTLEAALRLLPGQAA
jgi:DNA ligase-1